LKRSLTVTEPAATETAADAGALADRLFAAIERGDIDAVRAVYSPDVVVWHNNDEVEQGLEENLRVLGWVIANLDDRRYEDVRRWVTDTGFVQQHVLRFTRRDGVRQEIPACLVARCEGGRITRIDEYLDSAHVARITG
jgi:ketosteroid isomerase-like protein